MISDPSRARAFRGEHFYSVLFMAPSAAIAILALREIGLVSNTPVWLIPILLVGGEVLAIGCDAWWRRSPGRLQMHTRIATQAVVVTATIYATGWGPALAIGTVLVGQETLAVVGSSAERAVLAWNLSFLAIGEGFIALGWVPTLIPVPEVHGLAALAAIGVVFSYRSLRSALVENEAAASRTDIRERRFRALVQSSSDLVFVVEPGATVTYASPSCTEVLGYTPEELLGSGRASLIDTRFIEDLRTTVAHALETPGGTAEFAMRVRHGDGSWHWLDGIATNLLDDPSVHGVVINARDVT
ncbi:MAG: PAS domain S-box protein, partial [Acidimicrobiia bacterium]